jgi:hypothetical protein
MNGQPSDEARDLHQRIHWAGLRDLRDIPRLDERALEVLKGLAVAGIVDFVSGAIIHEIIKIQTSRNFASSPSNVTAALRNSKNHVDKCSDGARMLFRHAGAPHAVQFAPSRPSAPANPILLGICERFHRAIGHLVHRRKGKHPIDFRDEYDVQDVFGTIIKCCYEDVRDEEWTPSYAGRSKKIDFVVADIRTAAELKRARNGQDVARELAEDIMFYKRKEGVDTLVCFVYDPDNIFRKDAAQIEKDLSGHHTQDGHSLDVIVIIRPR